MIRIEINDKEFIRRINAITGSLKLGQTDGLRQVGEALTRILRTDILSGAKSGDTRMTRIFGKSRLHTASAGGESPANRTGNLVRSTSSVSKGSSQLEFGYSKKALYGKYLELGTSKMEARPGLQNTVNSSNNLIRQYITQALERQLKTKGLK